MKRLAIIATALLLSAGGAAAENQNGNELLTECTAQDTTLQMCIAYIRGARDMLDALQLAGSGQRCIPQLATLGQVKDVVVRYLRQHPEERHYWRATLIIAAVREAWCPDDDSPTVSRIPEQPQWKKVPQGPMPVNKRTKPLPLDPE
jgi:Rap1a immunity proteins